MKIPAIIISFLAITLTASAQIEREPAVVAKADTVSFSAAGTNDKMSRKDIMKELNLTREQKVKLKEIRQSNQAAKTAIENNADLSDKDKKKQLRDLQKEQVQKIQAILTPEQLAKFKANRQNNQ